MLKNIRGLVMIFFHKKLCVLLAPLKFHPTVTPATRRVCIRIERLEPRVASSGARNLFSVLIKIILNLTFFYSTLIFLLISIKNIYSLRIIIYLCKEMSVYLRKKDRIYSQKSTRDNYINLIFRK